MDSRPDTPTVMVMTFEAARMRGWCRTYHGDRLPHVRAMRHVADVVLITQLPHMSDVSFESWLSQIL